MSINKSLKKNRAAIKNLMPIIGAHKGLLVLSFVLAAASVILQLYVPIVFGNAIDNIIAKGNVNFGEVTRLLIRAAVIIAVSGAATFLMTLINNRVTYRVVQEIRSRAIRRIQKLPLSFLDTRSTGDTVSRVITDTDVLSDGLLLGFTQLFSGVVTIAVTLVFMFSKNAAVSLLVVALTPLSFFVAKFISGRSFNLFIKQSEIRGRQTGLTDEMISGQKTVRAFGYQKTAAARFQKVNGELTECGKKAVFYSSLTNPSTRFVNNIIYAGVALCGVLLIPGGSLTVGGLAVMLAYANQYMKPFNDISSVITELQNALACATRVFELLNEPEETPDPQKELGVCSGRLELKDVCFSYDKSRPLIEDLNLTVRPGQRVAIVGPTGCGKTTLINLLMRFYDTDSGTISADGVPIKEVTRRSLRKNFGMVLQETWIKSGTVRENIAFGKPDASDEEIIAAAKAAHCYEFIKRLPQGLDTPLYEGSLSQGQKQLLCIARVMLCVPPMLILDEATSSIDTRTELLVQRAFENLMKGRTSFIVAHRLSTVRDASVILVMRDGKIIEQGTHEELLKKHGFYENLYNSQFSVF